MGYEVLHCKYIEMWCLLFGWIDVILEGDIGYLELVSLSFAVNFVGVRFFTLWDLIAGISSTKEFCIKIEVRDFLLDPYVNLND